MQTLLSGLDSSESLMAGLGLVREREDKGLGSCGGWNAADADLLAEMDQLQALKAPTWEVWVEVFFAGVIAQKNKCAVVACMVVPCPKIAMLL